jgi:hypothetical protein
MGKDGDDGRPGRSTRASSSATRRRMRNRQSVLDEAQLRSWLDEALTRADDRALFMLPAAK